MRAAYIEGPGPPETIRIGELPEPRPGPGEVLVDVDMTVVNHVDTFVRSGVYRTPLPLPFIIGRDLVGVVLEVGSAVSQFAEGDSVWCNSLGHAGRQGSAAQRAVVLEERLYHLPPGADPGRAVAIAHPAATAHLALKVHGRVRRGELVVVTGAGGNVGAAAVVQAVLGGARVIATAAPHDAAYCRSLGAENVVDYRDRKALQDIRDLAPDGVDAYVDAAGDNDLPLAVDLLAPRGRIVLLAGAPAMPTLPVGPLYTKDGSVRSFAISTATVAELTGAASTVNALLTGDHLRPRATEVFALDEASAVHRRVEEQGLHGSRFLVCP